MRSRTTAVGFSVLLLVGTAAHLNAQLEKICGARSGVQAGAGTSPYDPATGRLIARPLTFDEFYKFKYPRTIRTAKDMPSVIAPKSRLGGLEGTLISIEGWLECGVVGSRGGGFYNFQLQETPDVATARQIRLMNLTLSCANGSPQFERLKTLDREQETWIGGIGGTGCGFINNWVRVIGYGF